MAKVKVKFSVSPKTPCENLYIVGSTSNLGFWDPAKATKLTYKEEEQAYVVNKFLSVDEVVEFKFVTSLDWFGVEKGIWNEEISNREVVPTKGLKLDLTIETFRKN